MRDVEEDETMAVDDVTLGKKEIEREVWLPMPSYLRAQQLLLGHTLKDVSEGTLEYLKSLARRMGDYRDPSVDTQSLSMMNVSSCDPKSTGDRSTEARAGTDAMEVGAPSSKSVKIINVDEWIGMPQYLKKLSLKEFEVFVDDNSSKLRRYRALSDYVYTTEQEAIDIRLTSKTEHDTSLEMDTHDIDDTISIPEQVTTDDEFGTALDEEDFRTKGNENNKATPGKPTKHHKSTRISSSFKDRTSASKSTECDMEGEKTGSLEKRPISPYDLRSASRQVKKQRGSKHVVAAASRYDKQQRYISDSFLFKNRDAKDVPLNSYAQVKALSHTECVNGKYACIPAYTILDGLCTISYHNHCTHPKNMFFTVAAPGDGLCMFHSIIAALQLSITVNELKEGLRQHPAYKKLDAAVKSELAADGREWGSLEAASLAGIVYQCGICVHVKGAESVYIHCRPRKSSKTIHLVWDGAHFDYLSDQTLKPA